MQPVLVGMYVGDDSGFPFYGGGTYGASSCTYPPGPRAPVGAPTSPTATVQINHAVLVVGYDTTASPPYWIVKNSWGRWAGGHGWHTLPRGSAVVMQGAGGCGTRWLAPATGQRRLDSRQP